MGPHPAPYIVCKLYLKKLLKMITVKTSVFPLRPCGASLTLTPKIQTPPLGQGEKQGWDNSTNLHWRLCYSLHQLLLCGRISEASEFFACFDLVKLGLEDCLPVLPEPFLPLHFFLLLEKSALSPDLCNPVFVIIRTLRTFCITWFSFRFFLLFLKIKIVRSSSSPPTQNTDPLFSFK